MVVVINCRKSNEFGLVYTFESHLCVARTEVDNELLPTASRTISACAAQLSDASGTLVVRLHTYAYVDANVNVGLAVEPLLLRVTCPGSHSPTRRATHPAPRTWDRFAVSPTFPWRSHVAVLNWSWSLLRPAICVAHVPHPRQARTRSHSFTVPLSPLQGIKRAPYDCHHVVKNDVIVVILCCV